jgi:carbon storage regulator CsrA
MLVISRKKDESVQIGDACVKILRCGSQVKLGISAPPDMSVRRTELQPIQVQPDADLRGATEAAVMVTGKPEGRTGDAFG